MLKNLPILICIIFAKRWATFLKSFISEGSILEINLKNNKSFTNYLLLDSLPVLAPVEHSPVDFTWVALHQVGFGTFRIQEKKGLEKLQVQT